MNIKNIDELLKSAKPKGDVDPGFKQNLYKSLMKEPASSASMPTIKNNFMNKLKLILPVAAVAVVAVVLVVSRPKDNAAQINLPGTQEITRLSANAFGAINSLNTSAGGGKGGGGGVGNSTLSAAADNKMAAPQTAVGMGGGGGSSEMIYPYPTVKYVYKGDEIKIDSDQMEVYERQKGFGSNVDLSTFLKKFNIGTFNINKFASASLDYFHASENRDQGYALDIDLKAGTVYIAQNWEKWPTVDYTSPIKINELPSDESAIQIANQFLDEYGISRSSYGTPEVQNMWRVQYERAVDKSSMYVPDSISVVYPVKISGNEIYDQGGSKNGMFVTINVRNMKVSSVGEITGQHYNSSTYPTEQDSARLIKVAENGGYQGYLPFAAEGEVPPNVKVQEIELGTPKIVYVRMWQTINNQGKDLYVPSLMFPIISQSPDVYQQSITVPLIKEMLDNQNQEVVPMTKSAR